VLEQRHVDTLTEEEESWRRTLVNGTEDDPHLDGEIRSEPE
jgi:probable phosphoglycerate mutase